MRIDALLGAGPRGLSIKASALAAVVVAAVVASSSIVFSEPAVADALMLGAIVGLPLLRVMRLGRFTLLNVALWTIVVAAGLAGATMSVTIDTAIKHQLVTLFLVLGAMTIAGYVAAEPEPRFELVMTYYVVACLVATTAALVGYFNVLPGAYDLFTNFGRGRGTYKDPNVYGAALVPALGYLVWIMLRARPDRALVAAGIAGVLALGLLVSFSRGAWVAAAVTVATVIWLSAVRTRRGRDRKRLTTVGAVGTLAFLGVVVAALQVDKIEALMSERASLTQSYDVGPEGRFGGQQKALALIVENPLGIGTHTFREVHHAEEPHNVYLSMFLNAGWLGGLLYVVSVAATLAAGAWRALRIDALQGPLIVATAAFAGMAVEGVIIDSDHWRHVFIVMGLVWGLVDAPRVFVDTDHRRDD